MSKEYKDYKASITITEQCIDGSYSTCANNHTYYLTIQEESDQKAIAYFENQIDDIIFQAMEIERIYDNLILVAVIYTRNEECIASDEYEVRVCAALTGNPSPYINWEVCNPATPKIYQIDKDKSILVRVRDVINMESPTNTEANIDEPINEHINRKEEISRELAEAEYFEKRDYELKHGPVAQEDFTDVVNASDILCLYCNQDGDCDICAIQSIVAQVGDRVVKDEEK